MIQTRKGSHLVTQRNASFVWEGTSKHHGKATHILTFVKCCWKDFWLFLKTFNFNARLTASITIGLLSNFKYSIVLFTVRNISGSRPKPGPTVTEWNRDNQNLIFSMLFSLSLQKWWKICLQNFKLLAEFQIACKISNCFNTISLFAVCNSAHKKKQIHAYW